MSYDSDDEGRILTRFTIESLSVQVLKQASKTACAKPTRPCGTATLIMCGTPSAVLWLNPIKEEFRIELFLSDLQELIQKHHLSVDAGPAL